MGESSGDGDFAVVWVMGSCAIVSVSNWWQGDSPPPPVGTTLIG